MGNTARTQKLRYYARRDLIWRLKSEPCTDCGQRFPPYVMQFDNVGDPTGHVRIARMMSRAYSEATILAEIAKCEVVCANCHAIRTYRRASLMAVGE